MSKRRLTTDGKVCRLPVAASCTETNKDPKTAERFNERDRTDQSAGFPVVAADCIGRALLRYLASFVPSRFDYGRSRTLPNQLAAAHPRLLRPRSCVPTNKQFSLSLSLSLFLFLCSLPPSLAPPICLRSRPFGCSPLHVRRRVTCLKSRDRSSSELEIGNLWHRGKLSKIRRFLELREALRMRTVEW